MDSNRRDSAPQVDVGTMQDVEAVMKKYDRESNVRIWEGAPKQAVRLLTAAFSLYCVWVTLYSTAMPEIRLNVFLGLILTIGYLNYPIKKGVARVNHFPWYDALILLAGIVPLFYFAWNAKSIIEMALRVTNPRNPDYPFYATMAVLAHPYTRAWARGTLPESVLPAAYRRRDAGADEDVDEQDGPA